MNTAKRMLLPLHGAAKRDEILDDFSSLSDAWQNGVFGSPDISVAGGVLAITPAVGANLYDAGKGVFTGGTEAWTAYGTNTMINDSGELKVTYVDNGQGAYVYLNDANDLSADPTVGTWYQWAFETRVSAAGSYNLRCSDGNGNIATDAITNTSLAGNVITFRCESATNCLARMSNLSAGESAWIDNETFKPLTFSSMVCWQKLDYPVSKIRAKITHRAGTPAGIILGKDADNFILLYWNGKTAMELAKCVAGVYTPRVATNVMVHAQGLYLELIPAADFQSFSGDYNDAGPQIVDAAITDFDPSGVWYAGVFATDANTTFDDFRALNVNF
jgi:hypothetical protein